MFTAPIITFRKEVHSPLELLCTQCSSSFYKSLGSTSSARPTSVLDVTIEMDFGRGDDRGSGHWCPACPRVDCQQASRGFVTTTYTHIRLLILLFLCLDLSDFLSSTLSAHWDNEVVTRDVAPIRRRRALLAWIWVNISHYPLFGPKIQWLLLDNESVARSIAPSWRYSRGQTLRRI